MHDEIDRARLARTKVRGDDDRILLVHHATNMDLAAETCLPLTHFGTRAAAKKRKGGEARMISAFIEMRQPLQIPDINNSHDISLIAELVEAVRPGLTGLDTEDLAELEEEEIADALLTGLEAAGFDGLAYRNLHEDPGSMSWMILHPSQVMVVAEGKAIDSRDPWELDEEEFTGPAIVSSVFDIDGESEEFAHLREALEQEGSELAVMSRDDDGWEARWLDDWVPEATMGLFDPDGRARGFYTHGQLWIDPEWRGHGRSRLLIEAAADLLGGCPAQNTQGLGYSEAGFAAHLAARREIRLAAEEAGIDLEIETGAAEPA